MNRFEMPEEFEPEKGGEEEVEAVEKDPELYMYSLTRGKIEEMMHSGKTVYEACSPALEIFNDSHSINDLVGSKG